MENCDEAIMVGVGGNSESSTTLGRLDFHDGGQRLARVCAPQRLRVVELEKIPELVQAGKQVQLWKITLKSLEDG
jgi:hypothetical protein